MASTVADESGFIDRTEEDKGTGFGFFPQAPAPPEDDVVQRALTVLEGRLRLVGPSVTSPQAVKDYLRLRLAGLEHEVRAGGEEAIDETDVRDNTRNVRIARVKRVNVNRQAIVGARRSDRQWHCGRRKAIARLR